ncbi:uncharacterized protein LOC132902395 [Amyelois transitella]|uniref:uncharacterized protein LOC132902395 n=1 Tax=Amyelois transitella TaxID=680683 RepID=UPI00299063AA|nr:uncharacterized protein LOC132902395 [Amyelois transitella]
MCCIFTCFGWMIDLVQRVWTFAMSCCISSAICCVMMTSSLSGIALGYNYSLAEYIDLKETNVSVYLKRGVFDDEIADDVSWRRSGNMPAPGQNQVTDGGPDIEETPVRSGRRLDDSVFDSNDHNKFEGSLMKLTGKPLDAPITPTPFTPDLKMAEVQSGALNELDRMKALQGLMNMRKYNIDAASTTPSTTTTPEDSRRRFAALNPDPDIKQSAYPSTLIPQYPLPPIGDILSGRRFDPHDPRLFNMLNPARTAVPDRYFAQFRPYTKIETVGLYNEIYPVEKRTSPRPVPLNIRPIRPSTEASRRQEYSGPPVRIFTSKDAVKFKDDDDIKSGDETDRIGEKMRQELSRIIS